MVDSELKQCAGECCWDILQSSPQPMCIYDAQTLAFLAVNDAAIHHYGYSRLELLTMTLEDVRSPTKVPDMIVTALRKMNQSFQQCGPWLHQRKDGSLVWITVMRQGLTYRGRSAYLAIINETKQDAHVEDASTLDRIASGAVATTTAPQEQAAEAAPQKVIRDGFSMPESDHALIGETRDHLMRMGIVMNKSEVLRSGLHALKQLRLQDQAQIAMDLEKVKTGRPPSKK